MIDLQTSRMIKMLFQIYSHSHKTNVDSNALQLSSIQLNEEYCKEWNVSDFDFVVLTKNGKLISDSIYRVGGFGGDIKQDYFMLIKYVEAVYDYDYLKKCYPKLSSKELESRKKHLEGRWCIFDKNGIEKKEFERFKTPYLTKDSCIYSIDQNYYNIETDEFYCYSSKSMESSEFLFLKNLYDEDLSKKGIMKINKKDGSWSVFK
jgi:hypothetical protein